jgi:hypothetical protein
MVLVPTPEVNSLAFAIKMLAVSGIFSLYGRQRATLLHHRFLYYLTFYYYRKFFVNWQLNFVNNTLKFRPQLLH